MIEIRTVGAYFNFKDAKPLFIVAMLFLRHNISNSCKGCVDKFGFYVCFWSFSELPCLSHQVQVVPPQQSSFSVICSVSVEPGLLILGHQFLTIASATDFKECLLLISRSFFFS